jgi:hypothetical protein
VTAPAIAPAADPARRLEALCTAFKLPTIRAELAQRLRDAGLEEALEIVVAVFDLEASDRQQRRVDRLRRASQLPPGKTFDTLDLGRLPRKLTVQLPGPASSSAAPTCWPSACPAPARPTR